MAARYVKFLRGTPKAYENLAVKDSDTLYFITEAESADGILYLGSKRIGGTGDLSVASIDELRDVLISENLSDNSFLVYDAVQQQWINKSFEELFPLFQGATADLPGIPGLVPAPLAGVTNRFLRSDGKWVTIEGTGSGSGQGAITAVDGTFFTLENQVLGLKDLPTSKIVGLDKTITAVDGLFQLLENKVDKQDGARLMTIEEGNRLSSLLGITAVSSDFNLTDGTLSLSLAFTKDVTEAKTAVSELNERVTNIEESVTWEIL